MIDQSMFLKVYKMVFCSNCRTWSKASDCQDTAQIVDCCGAHEPQAVERADVVKMNQALATRVQQCCEWSALHGVCLDTKSSSRLVAKVEGAGEQVGRQKQAFPIGDGKVQSSPSRFGGVL